MLIGAWGIVAAATALVVRPRPFVALLMGATFGVVVGVLQSKSMGQAGDLFRHASTAMDVRRALLSTSPGRWAIGVQWTGAAVLLATVLWNGSLISGFIAGYAALMFVREIITLRAVMRLDVRAV